MTQTEKIEEFIRNHGSITQREAITYLHCYRLGARIYDLENKKGVPVVHEMVRVKNADGSFTHIARYSLAETANG